MTDFKDLILDRKSALIVGITSSVVLCSIVLLIDLNQGEIFALSALVAMIALITSFASLQVTLFQIGLLLPLASTYLIPSKIMGISGLNPLNVIILVLAFLTATRILSSTRNLFVPKLSWQMTAFFTCVLVAGVRGAFSIAEVPDYFVDLGVIASKSGFEFLQVFVLKPAIICFGAWLIAFNIANGSSARAVLWGAISAGLTISLSIFWLAFSSEFSFYQLASQESRRYLSTLGMHANELGLMINTIFLISVVSAISAKSKKEKTVLFISAVACVLAAALTFSRGAYLGTICGICYTLFLYRRLLTGVLLLLCIAMTFIALPETIGRTEQGSNDLEPGSLSSGRVSEIWEPLIPEIGKNLLVGGGAAYIMRSDAARAERILPVGHTHNAYLGAILDVGAVGCIVIALFWISILECCRTARQATDDLLIRAMLQAIGGCFLIFAVQGVTDDSFLPSRSQSYVWLTIGIAWGLRTKLGDASFSGLGIQRRKQ